VARQVCLNSLKSCSDMSMQFSGLGADQISGNDSIERILSQTRISRDKLEVLWTLVFEYPPFRFN
jgi:hypothetical protein